MLALVDRTGTLLRRLDTQETIPPEADLKGMLSSMNFAGMNPADLPAEMRTHFILSLFKFVHSGQNLLLLEPGAGARIVEFSPGDQMRVVRLKLPDKQVADSILPSPDKWYVRTFPLGKTPNRICTRLILKPVRPLEKYARRAFQPPASRAQTEKAFMVCVGWTRSPMW